MNSKEGGGTIEPGSTLALALKGPNLEVHSVTAQGGHGVGPTFLVTKGQGNVVAELAGKPALNALRSVVGGPALCIIYHGAQPKKVWPALTIGPETLFPT